MRIYIIARGYPSKIDPTWGCFEKEQAEALNKLGHQVIILSVDTRFRFYWRRLGIQHFEQNNMAIYNIFLLPYALLFFIPKYFKNRFYAWQLEILYKRAVRKYGRPEILYSHYLHNTQRAIRIHQKYAIPLVAVEHWSKMAFNPIPKNVIKLAKQVYSSIDQLITVSSTLQNNIRKQVQQDSIVVPNMIGQEFCYQVSHRNDHTFRIISTGRLVPEKRFDLLIKAFANINQNLELTIIGNGPQKTQLQQLINKLHIENKVHLLGYKTKHEIVSLLQNSDLFVLPSQSETFGVAYVEALACGLPIIATDCGGPIDFVTQENGLLIPIDNLDALVKSILLMINNKQQYNRQTIALDCQSRFSSNTIAKKITTIFEKTIKKAKDHQ